MVDRHMGDGESACVSVCFKSSGFCYNKGGAEANADDKPFMLVRTALVTTKKASVLPKTL